MSKILVIARNTFRENIRDKIQQHLFQVSADQSIQFTISLGVVQFTESMKGVKELMGEADKCLYQAKRGGRNRVCISS